MSIKNLLVHVDDSRHQEKTNRSAILFADKFEAELTGCYVVPNTALALAGASPGGVVAPQVFNEMQAEAEDRAAAAEGEFKKQMKAVGREAKWRLVDAQASNKGFALAAEARYADLIVVGQTDPEEPIATDPGLPGDLVVDAGRPLVLVPHGGPAKSIGENILIGWNDSREAARAVYDALPFLVRAKTVTVVTVLSEDAAPDGPRPGSRIGDALASHGVNVRVEPVFGVRDSDVADALLTKAKDIRADMLVIGGYSHSRLREGLFGGVTNDLIEGTTVPLLMSH